MDQRTVRVTAWFDGACEPVNPGGHGSYGALVKLDGEVVLAESKYLGSGKRMSNNVAEYSGCVRVLEYVLQHVAKTEHVQIYGDSRLVVMQLRRLWRVKGGLYVPFYKKAAALYAQIPNASLTWVPRAQNGEADVLSKRALIERHVEFRIHKDEVTQMVDTKKQFEISAIDIFGVHYTCPNTTRMHQIDSEELSIASAELYVSKCSECGLPHKVLNVTQSTLAEIGVIDG